MTRKLSRKMTVLGAGALVALLVAGAAVAHGMGGRGFGKGFSQDGDLVTSDRASFRVDADAGTVTEYDLIKKKDGTTLRFLEAVSFEDWSDDATTASRGRGAYVLDAGDAGQLV